MESCAHSLEDHFYGSVTVGERGQVVIPAEARRRLNIQTGDKLLVMGHPSSQGVLLCRIDVFKEFITQFMEGLDRIEDSTTDETE